MSQEFNKACFDSAIGGATPEHVPIEAAVPRTPTDAIFEKASYLLTRAGDNKKFEFLYHGDCIFVDELRTSTHISPHYGQWFAQLYSLMGDLLDREGPDFPDAPGVNRRVESILRLNELGVRIVRDANVPGRRGTYFVAAFPSTRVVLMPV